jgi:hypothetical protein
LGQQADTSHEVLSGFCYFDRTAFVDCTEHRGVRHFLKSKRFIVAGEAYNVHFNGATTIEQLKKCLLSKFLPRLSIAVATWLVDALADFNSIERLT